jgi:hypothetical protein
LRRCAIKENSGSECIVKAHSGSNCVVKAHLVEHKEINEGDKIGKKSCRRKGRKRSMHAKA